MKENVAEHWEEKVDTPSGQSVVYIIDAMAFIQKHQRFGCTTFHELQEAYLDKIIRCRPKNCTIINVVDMAFPCR